MAKKSWKEHFSFVAGAVRYHDLVYVSMVADELMAKKVMHSYVTEWDAGTWRAGDGDEDRQNWGAVAAAVVKTPLEQAIFLGSAGQLLCLGSGDTHEEQIPVPDSAGPTRGIAAIDGEAYVCGMGLKVYKRTDANKWKEFTKGMAKPATGEVRGFEAIAGSNKSDIYVAGWNGEIWHFDGKTWSQQDSPTEVVLTSVCCTDDGDVYIAGQVGTLLKKTDKGFVQLKQKGFDQNIWSLAWFNGTLYAATMSGVYQLKKDQLEEISFGNDLPDTCYRLSAADGVLWSIGAKDIMSFDGKKWTRID